MYLLDSTHCLSVLHGFPGIIQKLDDNRDVELSINVVVVSELIYGAYKSEQVLPNLQRIELFLEDFIIFDMDKETADICAKLKVAILDKFGPKSRSKRRNTTIESLGFGTNDLWIASSAIQYNQILISADNDLWRLDSIEGLKIENW